jgi:hypothetical protein
MVDLEKRTINLRGKLYPITRFDVWWHVEGLGLFEDLESAMKLNLPVHAVSVAIGSDDMYEVLS